MIRVTKGIIVSAVLTVLVVAAFVGRAQAQGSRKDDIVFNAQGRPMAGVAVRICTSAATGQPCTPLAQIYSDAALTQALTNPLSADGLGNYSFYASPGRYMIEISGPGITTKQIPDVILPSDPSSPTFTSVTTTSGISAFSLSLTGNLTVNGSTAVAGSLTVGGAPVPSTSADNPWSAGQRFKGPVPWRDPTAYGATSHPVNQAAVTGTINAASTTLTLSGASDFANGNGIVIVNAGATATIATPAGLVVGNQGATGATTYSYQIRAIDGFGGTSACTSASTTTTGNATLDLTNFNNLYWTDDTNATEWAVYLAGTFLGTTPTHAYVDMGHTYAAPPGIPATCAAAASNDWLTTQIVSGGGTTTLVVANAAINTATTAYVQHDESAYFNQAAADVAADTGGSELRVPPGNYFVSHLNDPTPGITTHLAGSLYFNMMPWIKKAGGIIETEGGPIYKLQGSGIRALPVYAGTGVGTTIVVRDANWGTHISGIASTPYKDFIYMKDHTAWSAFSELACSNPQYGSCMRFDNNVIGIWVDRFAFQASPTTVGLPAIWFDGISSAFTSVVFHFTNGYLAFHDVRFDQPIGQSGQSAYQGIYFDHIETESNYDGGFVMFHGGGQTNVAPWGGFSGLAIADFHISNSQMADDIFAGGSALIYHMNPAQTAHTAGVQGVSCVNSFFNSGYRSANTSLDRQLGLSGSLISFSCGIDNPATDASTPRNHFGAFGARITSGTNAPDAAYTSISSGGGSAGPLANMLPYPDLRSVTLGSGSLGAGTYWYRMVTVDLSGGTSLPGPIDVETVGANSKLTFSLQLQQAFGRGLSGYRLYRSADSGATWCYVATTGNGTPNDNVDDGVVTCTSGALPTRNTAYEMRITNDALDPTFFAATNLAGTRPVGIGTTCKDLGVNTCITDGVKLDVKGGTLRGQGGVQAGTDTAFNASPTMHFCRT
jgi:hypothetical protein